MNVTDITIVDHVRIDDWTKEEELLKKQRREKNDHKIITKKEIYIYMFRKWVSLSCIASIDE